MHASHGSHVLPLTSCLRLLALAGLHRTPGSHNIARWLLHSCVVLRLILLVVCVLQHTANLHMPNSDFKG